MKKLLSTREVAEYLGVNEKMIYTLVAEKGLPASKVTGKWIFPLHLVEQWVETHTLNYPDSPYPRTSFDGLLIIAGSNDLLLEKTISIFNKSVSESIAVLGNLGSMGGLRALRQNLCHMAASHLLEENENDYNFDYAGRELGQMPVIVNFCRREQGILVSKNSAKKVREVKDLARKGIKIANRSLETGTRLLFDRELKKAGIDGSTLEGYHNEFNGHMDLGLEILAGRADAGPGIRPVASLLGLDFIPLRWERFDLLVIKDRFFDKTVQFFLGLLHDPAFKKTAGQYQGYDITSSGKIVFPHESESV